MGMLGHGVYSLPEAARLAGLKPQRVREWFNGQPKDQSGKSVFLSDYKSVGGDQAVSFHNLIEMFVAGQLRDRGVSLKSLRKVHKQLRADLGTRHPFCRREILTNHCRVLTLGLDEAERKAMIEVLTCQRAFADLLLPFLRRIDYDDATEMARRWRVASLVVTDPAICLGKAIIAEIGIITAVLAASYEANQRDAERVADWYKVHSKHVIAAVDFERSMAA